MIDVLNTVSLFFDSSPKRQRLLERVLDVHGSDSKVTKLKGLCKTRWAERHTCYGTFSELYEYIIVACEAILDPGNHEEVYQKEPEGDDAVSAGHGVEVDSDEEHDDVTAEDDDNATDGSETEVWNWGRETWVKAQGMLACLRTARIIVAFCVAKNGLEVVKRLCHAGYWTGPPLGQQLCNPSKAKFTDRGTGCGAPSTGPT